MSVTLSLDLRRWVLAAATPHGRLMLTVVGVSGIRARAHVGRLQAGASGGREGGRPTNLDTFQQSEARRGLAAGESLRTVDRSYGMSRSTTERLAR